MKRYPMTVEGEKQLRETLRHLKQEERPRIIKAIAEARAHGDLKENAEYHAAKEQQGFVEGRIADIEGKLSLVDIIDISKIPNNGKVIFGSTVKMVNLNNDEEVQYKIVGDDETDISLGKISLNSPIARAMIGKSEGDEVTVVIPKGEALYEIIEVRYT